MQFDITLHPILEKAIMLAYENLIQDAHHNLLLKYRIPIYNALKVEDGINTIKIRGWLAVLSAKLVLPVWEKEKPEDTFSRTFIEQAEKFLLSRKTSDEFVENINPNSLAAGGLYVDLDVSMEALYAAEAALLALTEAQGISLYKEVTSIKHLQKLETEIEQGFPDEMLQGKYVDCASMAVCAYSGISFDWDTIAENIFDFIQDDKKMLEHINTTFHPNFDPAKRLEFWQWWLTEAIPQAWELAHQSSSQ